MRLVEERKNNRRQIMAVKIDTNFNEETNQTEMRLDGEIDIYGSELFKEKIHELAKKTS